MIKQMFVKYRRFEHIFEGFIECEIGVNIKETEQNIKNIIIEKHAADYGRYSDSSFGVGLVILMVSVLN